MPSRNARSAAQRLAVIDVGSNSTRMEVLHLTSDYDLRVISEVKALLRLQSRIVKDGRLSQAAVDDLTRIITDFSVVAKASRVDSIHAVATSSIRNASNGAEILRKIHDTTGIDVEVIAGDVEARLGFAGAIFALPVQHGALVDIGGGSVEFSFFRDRTLHRVFTLDLGALRVSNDFLTEDPPARSSVQTLRQHVRDEMKRSGIPALGGEEILVGTGGTIRNLAKMERAMRGHSFSRLHGAMVKYSRLKRMIAGLRGLEKGNIAHVSGLNPDRADSILGGALVMGEIARFFDRRPLLVSGRGLREGLALSSMIDALPSIEDVRSRSIYALGQRFDTWDRLRADRRAALVSKMIALLIDAIGEEFAVLLPYAARVIDTGRSVHYYDRYRHAANILEQGELGGFSHRDIALISASIRFNDDDSLAISRYRPHLRRKDMVVIRRAAVVLRIADEMERRLDTDQFSRIKMVRESNRLEVKAAELKAWQPGRITSRFKRAFKLEFKVVQ